MVSCCQSRETRPTSWSNAVIRGIGRQFQGGLEQGLIGKWGGAQVGKTSSLGLEVKERALVFALPRLKCNPDPFRRVVVHSLTAEQVTAYPGAAN